MASHDLPRLPESDFSQPHISSNAQKCADVARQSESFAVSSLERSVATCVATDRDVEATVSSKGYPE